MSRAFVRESDAGPGAPPSSANLRYWSARRASAREVGESVPFQGVEAESVSIEP